MLTAFYLSLMTLVFLKVFLKRASKEPAADQQNFKTWAPLIALMMYFLEISPLGHPLIIHGAGLTVFSGQLLEFLAVKNQVKNQRAPNAQFLKVGAALVFWPLVALALLNILNFAFETKVFERGLQ